MKAMLKIWEPVNKVLTFLNLFLLNVLAMLFVAPGNLGREENKEGALPRIPLAANLALLAAIILLLAFLLHVYGLDRVTPPAPAPLS
jgi:hypothetical protein